MTYSGVPGDRKCECADKGCAAHKAIANGTGKVTAESCARQSIGAWMSS